MNAYDIETRIADEGRVPIVPLVEVHELAQGGPVIQDDGVKVTAALVNHPPVAPAFAYRFDARDRSIVISGDTTPCCPISFRPTTPRSRTTCGGTPRARTSGAG
jgi:hypothetical protein